MERNANWRYFDQGQDLQSEWRASYDDSSWNSAPAPFGYKDNGNGISTSYFGPLQTEVSYGSDKKINPAQPTFGQT